MAHPIITGVYQDGEKLVKLIAMKNSLSEAIRKWAADHSDKSVVDGFEMLDTYIGGDTYELMAQSGMNVLLAQKSLTEFLKERKIEGI